MGRRKHKSHQAAKKGPGASGGLGGSPPGERPEQEAGGPREPEVITQEHHQRITTAAPSPVTAVPLPDIEPLPPIDPTPPDSPSHSVEREGEASSVSEDTTTFTSCPTEGVATPSEKTSLHQLFLGGQANESSGNSDSEYESAEEVDLPRDPAPGVETQSVTGQYPTYPEGSKSESTGKEVIETAGKLLCEAGKDTTSTQQEVLLQAAEICVTTVESSATDVVDGQSSVTNCAIDVTDGQQLPFSLDQEREGVPQKQPEFLPSIISDSLVTVTKSEIIEYLVSEKEILVDESVTISPNDVHLVEKVSEVEQSESWGVDGNLPVTVKEGTESSSILTSEPEYQVETPSCEALEEAQNNSVRQVEESSLGQHPDKQSQVGNCEIPSEAECDSRLVKEEDKSNLQNRSSLPDDTASSLKEPEQCQGTQGKEESHLEGPAAYSDAEYPHNSPEAGPEEEHPPSQHSERLEATPNEQQQLLQHSQPLEAALKEEQHLPHHSQPLETTLKEEQHLPHHSQPLETTLKEEQQLPQHSQPLEETLKEQQLPQHSQPLEATQKEEQPLSQYSQSLETTLKEEQQLPQHAHESESVSTEEPQPTPYIEDPADLPIPPKKSYNLDFLDNLDDPNFNPFTTKTAVRSTPPPSPDPVRKLPPLKPTVKKEETKDKKKTPADGDNKTRAAGAAEVGKIYTHSQEYKVQEVLPGDDNITNNNNESLDHSKKLEDSLNLSIDDPVKPPRKVGRKPDLKNKRKPVPKVTPRPKVVEKNNNTVESGKVETADFSSELDELPIPPSKGYNLDFLDQLDDPNFNPFATKTAVRNSPPKEGFISKSEIEEEKAKVVTTKKGPAKKGFATTKFKAKANVSDTEDETDSPCKLAENTGVSDRSLCKQENDGLFESPEESKEDFPASPTKGYNLDFLNDPNFDPFQTRPTIENLSSESSKLEIATHKVPVVGAEEENLVSSKEYYHSESDINKSKDSGIYQDLQPQESLSKKSNSETDFGVQVESVSDQSEKDNVNLIYEELHDVNDNSKLQSEKSNDIENTKVAEGDSEDQADEVTSDRQSKNNFPTKEKLNQSVTQQSKPILEVESENKEDIGIRKPLALPETDIIAPKVPSIGTIGQLDSLEFDQLLGHEASRLAEEFMNCSTDSGLPDSDESTPVKSPAMADTRFANNNLDENVNPFQKSLRMSRSPPLGKRGVVCGAESSDAVTMAKPFLPRRSQKRESVMGEERMETASLNDDSGIGLGSRSDLETDANHSEAGPEIAMGLTSIDLQCASQFFKEATDLENQLRRTMISPLRGSHSKLSSSEEGTPTKERKDPSSSCTPESPQNKPVPSTSSPARPLSSPAPPREERSAPEGTSSPTPRPTDTSERKLSSTRPISAPPEGYMTATEVQELLKRQELKFEEKLLQVELAAGEKEKKLHQTMKDEQKDMSELTQSRDALLKMVGQYKGMLASLVSEKEKEKLAAEERFKALECERNQALDDLANVEVAFSDVHRKYERTKQVVDTLRRNEDTLRGAVADYEAKLQKQEQKFIEFQKHAEEKIQLANEEFEAMRKSNEQEMTKMAALLKKAEMKIMSLQDAHDRKTRENQELTQLCDDLINKVGK